MTFASTNNEEKSSYHDRDFPVIFRNELTLKASVVGESFLEKKWAEPELFLS